MAPDGAEVVSVRKTNVMAIVGLVSSFLVWPAGLACSIVALFQIRKTGEEGRSIAIAGIIISGTEGVLVVMSILLFWSVFWGFFGFYDRSVERQQEWMDKVMSSYCSITTEPEGATVVKQNFFGETINIGRTPTKVPRPAFENEAVDLRLEGYEDARGYLLADRVGGECVIHVKLRPQ